MAVILVTGAASGIGRATAETLAARGDRLVLFDSDSERLGALAEELADQAAAIAGSVSDEDDCRRAVDLAIKRFGGLDGLSHNAGIQRYGTAQDTPRDIWNEVISVNLTGAFLAAQAALPPIRAARGAIVFTGSVQSLASQKNVAAYTASKHGLLGLARSMAMDFAADGVRVNMVAPGAVRTPMLEWAVSLSEDQNALWSELDAMHPVGRVCEPGEVASVIAFLLSDDARFVTGESVRVDGGLLAQIAGTPRKAEP